MSDDRTNPKPGFFSVTPFGRGFLTGLLLGAALAGAGVLRGWISLNRVGAPASGSNGQQAGDPVALTIAQQTAQLAIKPHTVVLTSDQALAANAAVKRGDYPAAEALLHSVLMRSSIQGWHYVPFNTFISRFTNGNEPTLLAHLDDWIKRDPASALPYLLRAEYEYDAAWTVRGNDYASMISTAHRAEFRHQLDLASQDLGKSIELDPGIPYSYYLLEKAVSGEADSPEMEAAFQRGIAKFPAYYPLYRARLNALAPKWGGSVNAMYDFTDRYAGKIGDASPLGLLYIQLYANLVDIAAADCRPFWNEDDPYTKCISFGMGKLVRPGLDDHVLQAMSLYDKTDRQRFNLAFGPLLTDMVGATRDSGPVATLLQLAARSMGGNNQMMETNPGHNNYVLDEATAESWIQLRNYGNAEQKYKEALKDIDNASFASEEDRDQALAGILDDLTHLADYSSQYTSIIVYQNAADAAGGTNHGDLGYLKCYAYYKLRHFDQAVRECTAQVEGKEDSLFSRYWRAKAYEGLEDWDAAIRDYTLVADSENNWFRVGAALNMSYDYGRKNDVAGQLKEMNSYPYLFDDRTQSSDDIATAYNNRCYAYMHLGQLEKALDDCTASLRYGKIPDALNKQQELIERLRKRGKNPQPTAPAPASESKETSGQT